MLSSNWGGLANAAIASASAWRDYALSQGRSPGDLPEIGDDSFSALAAAKQLEASIIQDLVDQGLLSGGGGGGSSTWVGLSDTPSTIVSGEYVKGGTGALTFATPTPGEIGAANEIHASSHFTGGADALTAADIGAANETHASSHFTGGSDVITPADIGAADETHASSHATGGADALTAADIGAADETHASSHFTGGSDVITPADIGAEPTLSDSGFITVTSEYASGWSQSSMYTVAYRKVKNLVTLTGLVERSSNAASPITILTLPVGYRPPHYLFTCSSGYGVAGRTNSFFVRVYLDSSGHFDISQPSAIGETISIADSITFLVVNFSYFV